MMKLGRVHAEMTIPGAAEFQAMQKESSLSLSAQDPSRSGKACGHCCVLARVSQGEVFRYLSGLVRRLHRGVTIVDGMTAKQFGSAKSVAARLRRRVKAGSALKRTPELSQA